MEILHNEKSFRYLSGLMKYLKKIKETTKEEEILKFNVRFDGHYYHLFYEYRW